ncbi:MAG: DUF892 family protein [Chitinophagaceae bacterium]|nr:DUF892 family protein [Chitinophagaceae bacterium]
MKSFFEEELKSIYWVDTAIMKMLARMGENSISDELFTSMEDHINVKEEQLRRLEEIFNANDFYPEQIHCKAFSVLIKELEHVTTVTDLGIVRDSWIISVMQKIEFYVITSYGTLRTFANLLGQNEVADLLQQTLDEEKAYTLELNAVSDLLYKDFKDIVEVNRNVKTDKYFFHSGFEQFQGIHRQS